MSLGRGRARGACVLAAVVLCACALGPAWAGGPRLVIPEQRYDFGTVEEGTVVRHAYVLRNEGDAPLKIEGVKPSCGCTAALLSAHEVPPGGSATVEVTFKTAHRVGRHKKTVTIYSSDPQRPVSAVALIGKVNAELWLEPYPLYLGHVRRGEAKGHELRVRAAPGTPPFEILGVGHTHPALEAKVLPPAGPADRVRRIMVRVLPDMPLGRFNDRLVVRTSNARYPLLSVPVFGSVEGDLVVLPPQVSFGTVRRGRRAVREVRVHNQGQQPVGIVRVDVPEQLLPAEVETVAKGRDFRVRLRLRPDLAPQKLEGTVEIVTSHPRERRLRVPIFGRVRTAASPARAGAS